MVFQHFSLFEALDVAENVALGMENPPPLRDLAARIRDVSEAYGLPLGPVAPGGRISAGERQRVEIVRCLLQDPKLLIMDEPTSVLTPQEVDILFRTLRKLSDEGTAILYISHKLDEIRSLCSEATILRGGKKVATCDPREKTARELAELMVGQLLTPPERPDRPFGEVVLQVDGLSLASINPFGTSLKDINFSPARRRGAGHRRALRATGRTNCCWPVGRIAQPARPRASAGQAGGHLGPNGRREAGLIAAPEERLGHAAAPDMSLTENAYLSGAHRKGLVSHGFVDWSRTRRFADAVIARFDVRTPGRKCDGPRAVGGQFAEIRHRPRDRAEPAVIVVNQPTWGVDASAAATIRQALLDLASQGAGVVVISQDLDELLEVADSFAALNAGA